MAEEIGFENGRNSNFQGLVTLTLTLDPAIRRHTVVHQSSTSTYIPNFIQIEETFCGRTDVWTDGHFSPSNIIRSTFGSRPKYISISTSTDLTFRFNKHKISHPSKWETQLNNISFHCITRQTTDEHDTTRNIPILNIRLLLHKNSTVQITTLYSYNYGKLKITTSRNSWKLCILAFAMNLSQGSCARRPKNSRLFKAFHSIIQGQFKAFFQSIIL